MLPRESKLFPSPIKPLQVVINASPWLSVRVLLKEKAVTSFRDGTKRKFCNIRAKEFTDKRENKLHKDKRIHKYQYKNLPEHPYKYLEAPYVGHTFHHCCG